MLMKWMRLYHCVKQNGILFPLEGIVNGHHRKEKKEKMQIIKQLSEGVPLIVTDPQLTPEPKKKYSVGI